MNAARLRWGVLATALVLGAVFIGACQLVGPSTPLPTLAPTLAPLTPTPTSALFSISGQVWQDVCAARNEGQPPPAGCVVAADGNYRANGVFDSGESAISGVLVNLGSGACPSSGLATAVTGVDGRYSFSGLSAGTYCASIDFSFTQSVPNMAGHWTCPAVSDQSGVAGITLTLPADGQKPDMGFGWEFSLPTLASATPAPVSSPIAPPPTTVSCVDGATFVSDVTIPDKAVISPGTSFVKTWRLRNSGACAWTTDYSLVFVGGDLMGGPLSIPIPIVPPGNTIDLSVTLTAPTESGLHKGEWKLRNASGVVFGVGAQANESFWVQIAVNPTATPQPVATDTPRPTATRAPTSTATPAFADWRGEYYNNRDLSGAPQLTRNDLNVNFNWGDAAPAAGLPADNFSVRWTRPLNFLQGTYRFFAHSDDGVKLWLDGALIIDQWHEAKTAAYSAESILSAGVHQLRVEYYESLGTAQIQVWWERLSDFPDWRGEYFSNANLEGAPALVRNDAEIDFSWGQNAPATALPADRFSARWSRSLTFEAGTYRFHVLVDDGAVLQVDGQKIVDEWRDGVAREVTADYALSQGAHALQLEFYENVGDARIRLWWERLAAPSYLDWKGEYWSNQTLNGSPALVRNDLIIDFDWGANAPAPLLPADSFSVRWSRNLTFETGLYRFNAFADDGLKVYVDGQRMLNEWHDSDGQTVYTFSLNLTGTHSISLEYYEHSFGAKVRFWWERLTTPTASATATQTSTATATGASTATNTATATATPTATATSTSTATSTATSTQRHP